jgi:hypothetical protein
MFSLIIQTLTSVDKCLAGPEKPAFALNLFIYSSSPLPIDAKNLSITGEWLPHFDQFHTHGNQS